MVINCNFLQQKSGQPLGIPLSFDKKMEESRRRKVVDAALPVEVST